MGGLGEGGSRKGPVRRPLYLQEAPWEARGLDFLWPSPRERKLLLPSPSPVSTTFLPPPPTKSPDPQFLPTLLPQPPTTTPAAFTPSSQPFIPPWLAARPGTCLLECLVRGMKAGGQEEAAPFLTTSPAAQTSALALPSCPPSWDFKGAPAASQRCPPPTYCPPGSAATKSFRGKSPFLLIGNQQIFGLQA